MIFGIVEFVCFRGVGCCCVGCAGDSGWGWGLSGLVAICGFVFVVGGVGGLPVFGVSGGVLFCWWWL